MNINELHRKVQREQDIIKIMIVFPVYHYKANPTPEQVEQLIERTEAVGGTGYLLCRFFASGDRVPDWLDALITELAVGWRPSGDIVESCVEQRYLG